VSRAKQAAGEAAAELVEDGMRLGLGTGSTVAYFLEALARRRLDVAGVPTSEATADRCRELGIDLLGLDEVAELDLVVDGADELTRDLALTKGGGGALLREKVVASMGERFVVIATPDKVVDRLGATFPLPIEVVDFAVPEVVRRLRGLGVAEAMVRGNGSYRTDNGNAIVDAVFADGIDDVDVLDVALALLPGVAEHGLFVDLATEALLGTEDGVERIEAPTASTEPTGA
jgi:ribose 5-phosphate isomerase A